MSIPVPFSDIIEKEVITNIPKIYQKLKQIYKDLQFKTEEELGVVYPSFISPPYAPAFINAAPPTVPGIPLANSKPV